MFRVRAALILSLTTVPVAGAALAAGRDADQFKVETARPVSRAEAFRYAISLHDEVPQAAQAEPDPVVHPFWKWLLQAMVGGAAIGIILFARNAVRFKRSIIALAALILGATIIGASVPLLSQSVVEADDAKRLREAEWRWRLDLARASVMPDDRAKSAVLEAAQRFRQAATRR